MKLGGRIAIYFLVCAAWAGLLFGAAALSYDETARRTYALEVQFNQELLKHRARMEELKLDMAVMDAEHRLYMACMKKHPDLGPEGVDLCRASAQLDVATAKLKAARAARAAQP